MTKIYHITVLDDIFIIKLLEDLTLTPTRFGKDLEDDIGKIRADCAPIYCS